MHIVHAIFPLAVFTLFFVEFTDLVVCIMNRFWCCISEGHTGEKKTSLCKRVSKQSGTAVQITLCFVGSISSNVLRAPPKNLNIRAKSFAVLGNVSLYGIHNDMPITRLSAQVLKGQSVIYTTNVTRWAAGDMILITSTTMQNQSESAMIADVQGNMVVLSAPLLYSHWGAASAFTSDALKLKTSYREADFRARVALLTRSITIKGSEDADGFGCVWSAGETIVEVIDPETAMPVPTMCVSVILYSN